MRSWPIGSASITRRILAIASLGVAGVGSLVLGATTHGGAPTAAAGVLTAAGALLYLGRSATSQVLARAAAWAVIVPHLFTAWLLWTHGFPPASANAYLALPALAAISLVVARPLLRTEDARASFAPIAMRTGFLAAATAAVAVGIAVTRFAVGLAFVGQLGGALLFSALAASLVASGIGVVRMRGWGVLVAALSAVLGGAVAWSNHRFFGWSPLFLALPGALTLAALLAARAGYGAATEKPSTPSPVTSPARSSLAA